MLSTILIHRRARSLYRLFRVEEWKDTKLIWILIFIGILFLGGNISSQEFPLHLFYLVSLTILYYIAVMITNDLADKETDRVAGKDKEVTLYSHPFILFLIVGFHILYIFLLGFAYPNWIFIILGLFTLFLGTIGYSVKPFRLKERGIWGAFFGGILARFLPIFMICFYFNVFTLVEFSLMLFLLVLGIRQMLIHQIKDIKSDRRSGTVTFGMMSGRVRSYLIANKLLYGIELITLSLTLVTIYLKYIQGVFYFGIAYVCLWLILLNNQSFLRTVDITSTANSFPADLYFIWFPVFIAFLVGLNSMHFWYFLLILFTQRWHIKNFWKRIFSHNYKKE